MRKITCAITSSPVVVEIEDEAELERITNQIRLKLKEAEYDQNYRIRSS